MFYEKWIDPDEKRLHGEFEHIEFDVNCLDDFLLKGIERLALYSNSKNVILERL